MSISWRARLLALASVLGLATLSLATAPTAHATTPDVIAAAGSDAADHVLGDVLAASGRASVYNIPSQAHITSDFTVPADPYCNSVTYNATGSGTDAGGNPKVAAPLGAGQGQTALDNSVAKTYPGPWAYTGVASAVGGCVDIARLASKSSVAGDQSYAYAVDAVGWASPSLNAPAALTLQDLRDIWNCNLNDWSQVGGGPGAIVRVLPPFGGGTRRFFINSVLGITAETSGAAWNPPVAGVIPAGHPGAGNAIVCPPAVVGPEQSNGNALLTPATRVNNQQYITLYDAGNWVSQANNAGNPTLDLRGGERPGGIIGVAPSGSFPAAYPVRWTGTAWRENDGTILGSNATLSRAQAGVSAAGQFAATLTAAPGTFLASDVGLNVQGSFINDGTVITAVAADGSSATISPGAKAAGTSTAQDPLLIGWAVVSEKNPVITNTTSTQYPGVRLLTNALNPNSPDYTQARDLVGYDDTTPSGTVSALCNGSDEGIISDNGLISLRPLPAAVNSQAVTCRKQ